MGRYATIPVKKKTKKEFDNALTTHERIDGEALTANTFMEILLEYWKK